MLAVPANVTSLPIWKLGVKVNVFRASSLKFFKDGTVHLLYLSGNLPAEHVRQVPQCCWYLHQSDLPWAAHAPLQQVLSDPVGISYDSLFAIRGERPISTVEESIVTVISGPYLGMANRSVPSVISMMWHPLLQGDPWICEHETRSSMWGQMCLTLSLGFLSSWEPMKIQGLSLWFFDKVVW